ncbi:MAG TPA: tRNA 2-thiouridine(34) synthase MnmA [Mycoplasmatales bacterium]|jgi:tRNA-uridine 2-sulfurtransferase|nr:tRNA 2-thiouridine(34) synthase MnmA [Mycoplasmatales bacterium]
MKLEKNYSKEKSSKKVVIGISGGVDSAVSSYLLKKSGCFSEIKGVFMKNWDDFIFDNKSSKKCTQVQDWKDAKEIANSIGIEINEILFIEQYWNEVFSRFITDIKSGITPNPDVFCNKFIKFSYFFNYARNKLAADFIATGHYASIKHDKLSNKFYLSKCKDENKDQTYFLCWIDRKILPYLIFPISNFKKSEVREIAKKENIPTFDKKDSTGICFIGENNFPKFISNFLTPKTGEILDINNLEKVGSHNGNFLFTIGQKKGLNISDKKGPYYVVSKDIKKNIIYVTNGGNNDKLLYSNWCIVNKMNWLISENELFEISKKEVTVKFRHRQKEIKATISLLDNDFSTLKISLNEPVRAITPGQFAVLYHNEICLGGAIISSSEMLDEKSKLKI